jgi:hypothetical protein
MYLKREWGPIEVLLPDGSKLNRSDLPSRNTRRWVARRKLSVVRAVFSGLITGQEACEMYDLSEEELESSCRSARMHGTSGLKVTTLQRYRQP